MTYKNHKKSQKTKIFKLSKYTVYRHRNRLSPVADLNDNNNQQQGE